MKKPKLILIGAGGHCRSCIDVVEQDGRFEIAGIVDKSVSPGEHNLFGYPIIGTDEDLVSLREQVEYGLVTVGQLRSAAVRIALVKRLRELEFQLPTIISPTAYVSPHAWIGEGSMVMHDAVINAGASVGTDCIVNSKSLIEHDAVVGNHVHVSTRSVLNGAAKIGEQSFVGSGAIIINHVELPAHSFIRAGALVKRAEDCSRMQN